MKANTVSNEVTYSLLGVEFDCYFSFSKTPPKVYLLLLLSLIVDMARYSKNIKKKAFRMLGLNPNKKYFTTPRNQSA